MQRVVIQNKDEIREKILNYFNKNEEARYIHRLHGLLLLIDNKENTCDKIGKLFGNSPRSISNWVSKVNDSFDIESLRDKKRSGRTARLTQEQLSELKCILQLPPENNGVTANIWDGKSLSWFIDKRYGVSLKVRRCQDIFKELGFRLKRARPVVAKGDENKKKLQISISRKSKK
jgi:transposase